MRELFLLSVICLSICVTSCDKKLCDNTCPTNNDGVCDDGGENSDYHVCQLGSDCADCGERTKP